MSLFPGNLTYPHGMLCRHFQEISQIHVERNVVISRKSHKTDMECYVVISRQRSRRNSDSQSLKHGYFCGDSFIQVVKKSVSENEKS